MATHAHRWPHLLHQAADNPHHLIPGAQTAQILTRPQANQLEKLSFNEPLAGSFTVRERA